MIYAKRNFILPKDVSGLVCWGSSIDPLGNGSVPPNNERINFVADKSGNGNHATEQNALNQPRYKTSGNQTINNRPAFAYDGGNTRLIIANSASLNIDGDISIYTVVKPDAFGPIDRSLIAKTNSNIPNPYDFQINGAVNPGRHIFIMGNGSSFGGITAPSPLTLNQPVILTGIRSLSTANKFFIYRNRALVAANAQVPPVTANAGVIYIGYRADVASIFSGSYGEWIIYNKALSANEHAAVCRYLSIQWGIVLS